MAEFENRDRLHQQQMTSIRDEAEYQIALLSDKLDQETQTHQGISAVMDPVLKPLCRVCNETRKRA